MNGMIEPGTYYDLRYLNKSTHPLEAETETPVSRLFAIPTQFIFSWRNGELKAALRIPVAAL